jgi:hypothetical protein
MITPAEYNAEMNRGSMVRRRGCRMPSGVSPGGRFERRRPLTPVAG